MLRMLIIGALVVGQANGKPPNQKLKQQARDLVLQLNSLELAERQAAEKTLVDLGPAVLPYLPRTSSRTPAEVRQRLARVLQAVESMAAKRAVEATTITLEGKFAVADVFEELEKQSGNRVVGFEEVTTEITTAFKDNPYWQALDEVLDATGLIVVPGLLDMHVHSFWGVSHYGVDPDVAHLSKGVIARV